jgi:Xaa-Pro aminopeptidase
LVLNSNYIKRMQILSSELKKCGAEGCLVTSRANYRYFSGFSGSNAMLLVTENKRYLFTDFRYTIQAHEQAPDFEIIQETSGEEKALLNTYLKQNKVKKLLFEDTKVSYKDYFEMKDALAGCKLQPAGDTLERIRMYKDEDEIKNMSLAARLGDEAFSHLLGLIKPGVAECDIAAEIDYYFRKRASTQSFEAIVAGGPNSALCHAVPSKRAFKNGDMVVLDFGCEVNGYCSDMTRTVSIGKASEEMKKIYDIVLAAQLAALAALGPGKMGSEVDAAARNIIAEAGYGAHFGHGLGHSVGLEIHENPRLSPRSGDILEKCMTITVEPGIYIEGLGGVRIEDLCIINEQGYTNLTGSRKDLIEL